MPLKPFDTWPGGIDKEKLTAADDRGADAAISRRRLQLLAVHRGQRRGGRLRRQGRELGQAVRQRSRDARAAPPTRFQESWPTVPGITDLAVLQLARPADHPHRRRSRARRALRPGARRHQCGRADGDRRPSRRAICTSTAATGTFRSWCAWRRSTARASTRSAHHRSARRTRAATASIPVPLDRSSPTCELVSGASFIYREQQERYIPIKFSVRGRDLGSAVLEAQQQIARAGARCPAAIGSNGSASSAICRRRSGGSRSSCRSRSC